MASTSGSLGARIQLADPASLGDHLTGTPIVVAAFASGADFLHYFRDEGDAGELTLVTRARPRGRAELVLEIGWPALHAQFGAGYTRLRAFRAQFIEALNLAAAVYPEANISMGDRGVILRPSRPAVAKL